MTDLKKTKEPYKFSPSVEAELLANKEKRDQDKRELYEKKLQPGKTPDKIVKGVTEKETFFQKHGANTVVIIAVLVVVAIIMYRNYRRAKLRSHPVFMRVSKPTGYHKTYQEEMGAENE